MQLSLGLLPGVDIAHHDLSGGVTLEVQWNRHDFDPDVRAIQTAKALFEQGGGHSKLIHSLDPLFDQRVIIRMDEIQHCAANKLVFIHCAKKCHQGSIDVPELSFQRNKNASWRGIDHS